MRGQHSFLSVLILACLIGFAGAPPLPDAAAEPGLSPGLSEGRSSDALFPGSPLPPVFAERGAESGTRWLPRRPSPDRGLLEADLAHPHPLARPSARPVAASAHGASGARLLGLPDSPANAPPPS
jgi:hypothetical protein